MKAYIHNIKGQLFPAPHPLGDALTLELRVVGDVPAEEREPLLRLALERSVVEVRFTPTGEQAE